MILYLPALNNSFVNYDDPDYVTENPHVQQGLDLSTIEWVFSTTGAGNWHPLTWMSHALDCELFGLDAERHHLASVLLHGLNAALVFLLLQAATRKLTASLFAAALFGMHPLNVESVAWVAERKSVLCMFFFLLALAAYGWYARKPTLPRYLMTAALFTLSLMAKPMTVTFPFVLMLIDVWPLGRVAEFSAAADSGMPKSSIRQLIREKLPLLALAAASCVITLIAQRPALKSISAIPLGARIANAVYSYPMYLWHAMWPAHLGVFYAPQGGNLGTGKILFCIICLLALSVLAWMGRARIHPVIGWLWFLGTLVPMIGLVQAGEQGMADRYAYLPMLGIFVTVTFAIAEWCSGRRIRSWAAIAAGCAALVLLSAAARRQIATWENSYALWSHSLEIEKNNYIAEDYVGFALLESGSAATGQGCVDEALLHFRRAVSINAADALGHLNIGFCEQQRGQLREAVEEYQFAAASARSKFLKQKAYTNLGSAFEQMGDAASARAAYKEALAVLPNDAALANRLRNLNSQGGSPTK